MARDLAQRARSLRDFLLGDHLRLEALLGELIDEFREGHPDEVREMWARFDSGLSMHLSAEERYLLPLYTAAEPREAEALLAEHDTFRKGLDELGVGVDLQMVNLDVAQAFIDAVRAHARREDELLYRWAEREVGGSRQDAVARELGGSSRD
jgi:hemerythrin-like domain-containing protein